MQRSKKPPEPGSKKPLCTWVSEQDYDIFAALADRQGVTMAAYLRSIVVDAIADEMAALQVEPPATAIR